MVDETPGMIFCSWCKNNTFIPISKKIVKCEDCGIIKAVDTDDDVVTSAYDLEPVEDME